MLPGRYSWSSMPTIGCSAAGSRFRRYACSAMWRSSEHTSLRGGRPGRCGRDGPPCPGLDRKACWGSTRPPTMGVISFGTEGAERNFRLLVSPVPIATVKQVYYLDSPSAGLAIQFTGGGGGSTLLMGAMGPPAPKITHSWGIFVNCRGGRKLPHRAQSSFWLTENIALANIGGEKDMYQACAKARSQKKVTKALSRSKGAFVFFVLSA